MTLLFYQDPPCVYPFLCSLFLLLKFLSGIISFCLIIPIKIPFCVCLLMIFLFLFI